MKKIILVALAAFLAFTAVSVARNFDDGVAKKNLNGIPHAVNAKGALKAHSVGHLQLKNAIIDCQKLVISLRARVCGNRLSVPSVSGPAGVAGAVGETGAKGEKGDTGAPGTDGAPGQPGETGATGERGPKGYKGEKGDPGKNGTDGLGNGTIEACVSNGGTVQINVNGQPCDNEGHHSITLVIVKND